ncbi:MAG TPA: tyrosine-type recombinase/integrase [Ktedonobacteraceae bacterium]|nr:tyrosine-type recombinase/integrase [Ktedonobacteraceae bacterium]
MRLVDVVEQYFVDCENRGRAVGTMALYRRRLNLMLRWLEAQGVVDLEAVTLPLMRQFLNFLIRSDSSERYERVAQVGKLEPSTVATCVSIVKAFFQWCVDEDLLEASPAARLKKPKVPDKVKPTLNAEDIEKLLLACDTNTRYGFRDYVMILVFLDTGVRVSELRNLRLSDVHTRYVKVDGKGQKEREIGLHPDVSKLLWKYLNKCRPSFQAQSDYVFVGDKGPLTVSGIETIFAKLKKASGITAVKFAPHVLRHTHSKEYLKNGGDLFKLSRELGHSSVQVTGNVYLSDFKSADARESHDQHSPINGMQVGRTGNGSKGRKGKGQKKDRENS